MAANMAASLVDFSCCCTADENSGFARTIKLKIMKWEEKSWERDAMKNEDDILSTHD